MPKAPGVKELALRKQREAQVEHVTNGVARVGQMNRAEAKDITRRINASATALCDLLLEAYDRGAWAALGYDSWREYASAEFTISQSRAYQLLTQAKVQKAIRGAADSTTVEISERQARDVAPVVEAVVEEIRERVELGEPEEEVVAAVVQRARTISTKVEKPDPPDDGPDPVAEWERTAKELAQARETIEALKSSDIAKQYAELREKYARLEGRLSQEQTTRNTAEGTAGHWIELLRKIAVELGVKDFAEIIPTIQDLRR